MDAKSTRAPAATPEPREQLAAFEHLRRRRRPTGPRRMLAIGLVGTGLYAGLLGSRAAAEPWAPVVVAGASPETSPHTEAPDTPAGSAAPGDSGLDGGAAVPSNAPVDPGPEGVGYVPSEAPVDPGPEGVDSVPSEAPVEPSGDPVPEPGPPGAEPATLAGPAAAPATTDRPAGPPPEPGAGPAAEAPDASAREDHRAARNRRRMPNRSIGSGRLGQRPRTDPARADGAPHRHDGTRADAPPTSRPAAPSSDWSAPGIPTFSLHGPATAVGVPDLFVDRFRIPTVLLPIYRAAAIRYGVRWEILAAINEIETGYGRNLGISSAGALGWMQFMPATWKSYGVDANRDGARDPYNPGDAIFAAARYLRAAGAGHDLPRAIYAYNHADWYVASVLMRARLIQALPHGVLASLTWLGRGRLPVPNESRATTVGRGRNLVRIFAPAGARVVTVNDGTIVQVGRRPRRGRFVKLRDRGGNTYLYRRLRAVGGPSHLRGRLRPGARLASGTVVGRVGRSGSIVFAIRPAGRGAPRIDPRPVLAGWRMIESAALGNVVRDARATSHDRILAMSRRALATRVLADPRIEIYACGRADILAGAVDRRVLATLELLAESGLNPTVSSLICGHSVLTTSGNVSEHASGSAVDISAINGVPVFGHQGPGSLTALVVRRLLVLDDPMQPHQIITLMQFAGADNTVAMADHADHIHIGWRPDPDAAVGPRSVATLDARQWTRLLDRLGRSTPPRAAP